MYAIKAFNLLSLQPGGGSNGQVPTSLHVETSTTNPENTLNSMIAPGHRQANRLEGSNAKSSRGLGLPARHPRRHTSYHNPIPSAWHTPPPERQQSYGERTFGGWRDSWRDESEAETHGYKQRNRRSDIGPDTTNTSYHQVDSECHIGMGFGLDALRKKRRASSPARTRSTSMDLYEDTVDGSQPSITSRPNQSLNSDISMAPSSQQQRASPVSSSSTRHRRSNSIEGLLDNNVKLEGSSMSPSSHLTFRGVRSMKHGKSDKAYQEGMRKASSLTDLSTARSIEDDVRHSRQEDKLYRSRSRESLPDNAPSYLVHRRPVSDISHSAIPHADPHLHTNHIGGDTDDSNSKTKTFFETLRDSLLNPEPPKPKNYRYLKLAGIPHTKTIESYGTDVSIKSTRRNNKNSQETNEHQLSNATNTDFHCNNVHRNNTIHSPGGVISPNDNYNAGTVSSRNSNSSFSPHVVTNHANGAHAYTRGVTNNSVGGTRWNAQIESQSRSTCSTNNNNHRSRFDRNDLPSDFARKTLHENGGVLVHSMLDGTGGAHGAAGNSLERKDRGREHNAAAQSAFIAKTPSFAWEPRSAAASKGNSSVGGSAGAGPGTSASRAPSTTLHHHPQARHMTRSMTAPLPASGASQAQSNTAAETASQTREWHSSSDQGRESPPPTGGLSTGSSESYEDYFCRSPSPNSFFLNGRNKNETDEHKVSSVNNLTGFIPSKHCSFCIGSCSYLIQLTSF